MSIDLSKALTITLGFVAILVIIKSPLIHAQLSFTNPGPGGGSDLFSIEYHPTDADIFYIGGDIEGLLKTTDGGASYTRVTNGLADSSLPAGIYASQDIAIDPQQPDTLYLATWSGLYKSINAATSWSLLIPSQPITGDEPEVFSAVEVSPHDSSLVISGIGNPYDNDSGLSLIYRSTNGGSTWTSINLKAAGALSSTDTVIFAIVFDSTSPGVVYAATGEGMLKSLDNGLTWILMNSGFPTGTGNAGPIVHDVVGVEKDGNFLMFVTLRTQGTSSFDAGGVYRTDDGANTWAGITGNLPTMGPESNMSYCYWRLTVDPSDPNTVLTGTHRGWAWDEMGVYRTTNALTANATDVSWSWTWDFNNFDATFIDWGWLDPDWWLDQHVAYLGISPSNPQVVVAGADQVFKSLDGGLTWTEAYSMKSGSTARTTRGMELMEVFDVAVDPSNAATWWIGYDDMGLFKSNDSGGSFMRMDSAQSPDHLFNTDCACQLIVDPDDSNVVYMMRSGGDADAELNWNTGFLFKSLDAGQTWSQIGQGAVENGRISLLMFPGGTTDTRQLLALVYGKGLYMSQNSGASWISITAGLNAADLTHAWTLVQHPLDDNILYMGSADGSLVESNFNGAIYRSGDGGLNWMKLNGSSVPSGQIMDLGIASSGVVYAATTASNAQLETGSGTRTGGLYRSEDEGATWSLVLAQPRVDGVSVKPDDPTRVVAAVSSYWNQMDENYDVVKPGVYLSTDSGKNFTRHIEGLTHTFFWFIKYNPQNTSQILAGTRGGGLFVGSESRPDFTIDTSASSPITGLWWNALESGWGVALTQQFGIIFVTLYTYDDQGNPYWYVASNCTVSAAGCTGELYEVTGGEAITDAWEGIDLSVQSVGTITFSFSDNDNGTMSFTLNGMSATKTVTRQVFSTLSPGAAMNGLFYNPAESGWGVALTQQTNIVFVTIYTYDANGTPIWYVASNCAVAGEGCSGKLYRVTGGESITAIWEGIDSPAVEVGTITLAFSDSDTGTMSFDIDGVSGSKEITRQIWATQ